VRCPLSVVRLLVVDVWCPLSLAVILCHLSSSVVVVSLHGVAAVLAHITALPKGGGWELAGLPSPFPAFPLERGDVAMAAVIRVVVMSH
jgi:hypothetical protein